ncbi:CRAL-TRIO domain-containing protein C3H8.02-like [Thrips palmi]|uniref:CRAL-TRIO domain-containing protein C3H8.02-like n=1 Tax=Thrips palmi TaxID=161013 RepID=A0A6P9A1W4_THRPL|nr:CRAL-TRIO domain-containing protein C3H8.02-like [Thrips palmi]XP_034251264.1 CRAL-TRIO domain-containing protein C3H8.02-like [Thrips palmi]
MAFSPKPVNEDDLKALKERMKLISDVDPQQYHNDFSLKRYLRAFKTVDDAFMEILKTNKWRVEYGLAELTETSPLVQKYMKKNIAKVLKHRDISGRPVIYFSAKNHNVNDGNIDELTKFIVYCLEEGCKMCCEEVIDNLCVVLNLKNFGLSYTDFQVLKNLVWLGMRYPERLGICLMINAPALFSGFWTVVKGWLDETTSSKVQFIKSEEELCKYLIPDILPTDV